VWRVSPLLPPSIPFHSLASPSLSSPLPLEVGLLYSSYGVWGRAVSPHSRVLGKAPTEIDFDAF